MRTRAKRLGGHWGGDVPPVAYIGKCGRLRASADQASLSSRVALASAANDDQRLRSFPSLVALLAGLTVLLATETVLSRSSPFKSVCMASSASRLVTIRPASL